MKAHYNHSSTNMCKLLLQGQLQWTNIRDTWTSQGLRRPLLDFARKNTERWQMAAQHDGAVQVKALPKLWISFSLLLLPGVLYLPSCVFTAIKAAFI